MYYTFEQFKEAFIDELKQANAVDGDGRRISEDDKPYLKLLDRSKNRLVMFTKSPIQLIANERQRQVADEGWIPEHDDKHIDYELSMAAASYTAVNVNKHLEKLFKTNQSPLAEFKIYRLSEFKGKAIGWTNGWPWDNKWWKPSDDPIRNLVKAGALIVAEIERLQRADS